MAATESLDSSAALVTTASASQATESDTVSITAIIHNPQVFSIQHIRTVYFEYIY